ncbi:hypothetical protein BTO01_24200 [Vibrio jasicida]|uniref:hypothetical protein n=1 Tax=Vibrio jasicida TaxID=766224 RepID=UPI000CF48D2A|nr:hypothetical protein [Vibrio jasicida]PQJ50471.1 hypothetical protein BTO01_24200 [Vibrio jasicida]
MSSKVNVPVTLRLFNWITNHPKVMFVTLLLFNAFSVYLSFIKKDFNWLAASGGVTTIFGVLLTVSHSVPKTEEDVQNFVGSMFPKSRDGIMAEMLPTRGSTPSDKKQEMARKATSVLKAEALGLILTIVGTLVWAYAGFLTGVFFPEV